MEEKILSYFRIKTEMVREGDDGSLNRQKIEELVLASCYTEVEQLAYQLIMDENRNRFSSVKFEIIKTKIADVLYNDILQTATDANDFVCNFFEESETSGVGLYCVKVVFITCDEKTAKNKKVTELFYVPASSNSDATKRINEHLKGSTADFIIRDTKFDKAEAIYWPSEVYKDKNHSLNFN